MGANDERTRDAAYDRYPHKTSLWISLTRQFLQSLSILSFPPLAAFVPTGDQSTAYTSSSCPGRSSSIFFVRALHTLSVLSLLALTTMRESALHAIWYTGPTCPRMVARKTPVCPSHSFTALSKLADAQNRPSGENNTWLMSCTCPVILFTGVLDVAGVHMNMVKSSDPLTNRSGLPCVACLYLSSAFALASASDSGLTALWSNGPVRTTYSEDSARVLTQCPCPLS